MADLFTYIKEQKEKQDKEEIKKAASNKKVQKEKIYSVIEITRKIKSFLEPEFKGIWIEGELSNYKKHSSGHHYFSLKDDRSVISCVMWRTNVKDLKFHPEHGQKVRMFGNITVYEGSGRYQIDVKKMQISGIGELQAAFEELKEKLNNEGFFDPSVKKPLPGFIKNVGVITAETGAAFQDIRKVISSRAPFVNIYLYGARVQGKGTESELVEGLRYFNTHPEYADVIILGRGGGSLEDLWSFNEEVVARAVYGSEIPVISAVGHEIDFSISDFTADVRAATPSHAAELVSMNVKEELESLDHSSVRMNDMMKSYLNYQKEIINGIENSHAFKKPADLLKNYTMVIDNIEEKFELLLNIRLDNEKGRLKNFGSILRSLDPGNVLKRGYALVKDKKGSIVSSADKAVSEKDVVIDFRDGSADAEIRGKK